MCIWHRYAWTCVAFLVCLVVVASVVAVVAAAINISTLCESFFEDWGDKSGFGCSCKCCNLIRHAVASSTVIIFLFCLFFHSSVHYFSHTLPTNGNEKKVLRYERQEPQRRNKCNVQWTEKKTIMHWIFGARNNINNNNNDDVRFCFVCMRLYQSVVRLRALFRLFFSLLCVSNERSVSIHWTKR